MTQDNREAAARRIAENARAFLIAEAEREGMPLEIALAGFHAQVSALLALMLGGEQAAAVMRREADGIEGQLSAADIADEIALASAIPQGRA